MRQALNSCKPCPSYPSARAWRSGHREGTPANHRLPDGVGTTGVFTEGPQIPIVCHMLL